MLNATFYVICKTPWRILKSTHLNHRIFSKASDCVAVVKISMPIYSRVEALLNVNFARPTCSKTTKASFVCFTSREEREQHLLLRLLWKWAVACLLLAQILIQKTPKIIEKVAFNIESEASYIYIFSGQKFTKNAKNSQNWKTQVRLFW